MKLLRVIAAVVMLAGCSTPPMSERPPNAPDGTIYYPSIIEKYEKLGYRYYPPVILTPARLEYVGTNKPTR